jgi:uncharacterized protein (TIGR02118 family)
MTKVVVALIKKEGIAWDDFRRHWLDVHGPIALRMPGLRRYVQNHALAEGAPFDGIAELWFDSPADMQAAFTSPAAQEAAADATNFLTTQQVVLVEEIDMMPSSNS